MLSEDKTLEILKKTNSLLEGHFILSSGLRSEKYLQCAQLMMHADYAKIICESLASKIKKEKINFDLVASPAIGGILVGYEVSKFLNVPNIFVERVDVITTGKSSIECAECLKGLGGTISGYACIVDRSGGNSKINNIISQISFNFPTYEKDNLPEHLKNITPIKPGSRKA